MLEQVTSATNSSDGEYDVDAITDALIAQHVHVNIDDISADEFWPTVAAHEIEAAPDPAELSAAIESAPTGAPAVWTNGNVTLTVTGASRVSHTWPQPLAQIVITTPDVGSAQVATHGPRSPPGTNCGLACRPPGRQPLG